MYAIRTNANKQIPTCFAAGPFLKVLSFAPDIKEMEGSGEFQRLIVVVARLRVFF
jgi:hypothetical protein